MAADQLVADRGGHVVEAERALLARHLRVEYHLQQQVAQFVLQRRQVVAVDRVGDLVGLLDRVRGDGGEGLFDVPRAAVLAVTQAGPDVEQALAVGGRVAHCCFRNGRQVDGGRTSVVWGKSGSVRVDPGGGGIL